MLLQPLMPHAARKGLRSAAHVRLARMLRRRPIRAQGVLLQDPVPRRSARGADNLFVPPRSERHSASAEHS